MEVIGNEDMDQKKLDNLFFDRTRYQLLYERYKKEEYKIELEKIEEELAKWIGKDELNN